jgi:hypothetical protein
VTAVDDAISYLTTATPTRRLRRLQDEWKTTLTASDPLALENGMVEACKDFVTTTKDITGTTGTDGSTPFERVDKYGLATGTL